MDTVFDCIYIKWYYTAAQPKSKINIKIKLMECYAVCTIKYIYYTSVLCSERINVRENRRGNKKWMENTEKLTQGTQDEDKQIINTSQYVLATTMRNQTQIT